MLGNLPSPSEFLLAETLVSQGAIDPMRMQKVAATKTREVLPPKAAGKDQFLVFRAPDLRISVLY